MTGKEYSTHTRVRWITLPRYCYIYDIVEVQSRLIWIVYTVFKVEAASPTSWEYSGVVDSASGKKLVHYGTE